MYVHGIDCESFLQRPSVTLLCVLRYENCARQSTLEHIRKKIKCHSSLMILTLEESSQKTIIAIVRYENHNILGEGTMNKEYLKSFDVFIKKFLLYVRSIIDVDSMFGKNFKTLEI